MSARTVLTTDTLETFRTTFNSLSSTDIGDPATLTTTATSIVGAINELDSAILTAGSFTFRDSTSTTQTISTSDVLTFAGTSNQITATVSATDTVTFSLNSTISGITSLTASGTIQGATVNGTSDVQVNGISVATKPFAIAQAVALG
jgi:hypothetical protein